MARRWRTILAAALLVLAASGTRAEEMTPPAAEVGDAPPAGAGPAAQSAPRTGRAGPAAITTPRAAAALRRNGTLTIAGTPLALGETARLEIESSESFAGAEIAIPVLVTRGRRPGVTLCLTAGIHGDELNGIEVVRTVFADSTAKDLEGTLIGLPVVNVHGFRRSSRYLPDRRDLNRYFPGNSTGSSASRIARAVFEQVIRLCDVLVDFHTGSLHRSNLPQIRADLTSRRLLELARGFGVGAVVHNYGMRGTLRRAATDIGIAALSYEAGEPMRFQRDEIERGVGGIRNLMADLGMFDGRRNRSDDQQVYYRSRWIRVNDGGIFLTDRRLGDRVRAGEVVGTVTDPISNERAQILSAFSGRIIGMAMPQVVIPGFAAFHVGLDETTVDDRPVEDDPAAVALPDEPVPVPAAVRDTEEDQ